MLTRFSRCGLGKRCVMLLKVKPVRRLADGFGPRLTGLRDRVAEDTTSVYGDAGHLLGAIGRRTDLGWGLNQKGKRR